MVSRHVLMTPLDPEAASFYGLPAGPPCAADLSTVADLLPVFRRAGCHGTAWFSVVGCDVTADLPECPDPAACRSVGGLDLGEVTLDVAGPGRDEPLRPDRRVTGIGFRNPEGRAVLAVALSLRSSAGPLLVFDDSGDRAIAVSPADDPLDLAARWPW